MNDPYDCSLTHFVGAIHESPAQKSPCAAPAIHHLSFIIYNYNKLYQKMIL